MLDEKIKYNDDGSIAQLAWEFFQKQPTLQDPELRVLEYRFALSDDPRYFSLEEVGRIFNSTRERIRQVEAVALRKLGIEFPVDSTPQIRTDIVSNAIKEHKAQDTMYLTVNIMKQ